ncbi:MAG: SRPBCC domain-containing protein [Devosia sp.]|uniref:SRPBCC domain-containing protein n=1 Tax=Devosia sp. TaxID=1871048 RepID=UPI001AC7A371|nr:SRPBCC domain-containing protein [Devosia sp.]MBN9314975.1 SRPBCC domain-containing protein [Devosia sp.]
MSADTSTGGIEPNLATVETPADEAVIRIRRSFAAPRALVWRCYTDPVHLVHFWGPHGATNPVCDLDLRVGGHWRQVMHFPSGNEYGYTSAYLEITPPERLVWRDAPDSYRFGDPLPPAGMVTELTLAEDGSRTLLSVIVRFTSLAARDESVTRGFATTVLEGSEKLDAYLETLAADAAR